MSDDTNHKVTELVALTDPQPEDSLMVVDDDEPLPLKNKELGFGTFLSTYNKSTAETASGLTNDDLDFSFDKGNVKRTGAIGNGVIDDAAAIQATIDVYGQDVTQIATGGIVVFPDGTFKVNSTLVVYSGVHLRGAGTQATKINGFSIASGFVFRNVNNANHFSYRDMTVNGSSSTTCDGGIRVGNDSGDSGFTAYVSLRNMDITGFSKTDAIGLSLNNPSDMQLSNVDAFTVPNGKGLLLIANMTNTGVINFSGCKFGDIAATAEGGVIDNSNQADASVSEVSFNGTFFAGTTRALDLNIKSESASPTRNIQFNAAHFEVDNATANSECVLIQEVQGASFINCGLHGFSNTDNGFRFNHAGKVEGVDITTCYFVDIATTCVNVGSGGAGSYRNIKVSGIYTFGTSPILLADTLGVVTQSTFTVERNNSDVATSGTGEDDLHTTVIPAEEIGNIGGVKGVAAGTKTNANGNKTVKLHVGSTAITVIAAANDVLDWRVEFTIENTAFNVQRISWVSYNGAAMLSGYDTATEDTDAGTLTVKITGECANASDIVTQTMWHVEKIGT